MGTGAGMGTGVGMGSMPMRVPAPFHQPGGSDDRLYDSGQRALDNHRWDQAFENFSQVAAHGGSRADGALYWKIYTLYKLGRRDEALAQFDEFRKVYSNSRWLDDAKALEVEVKQAAGKPVPPESELDEDLKLMALNGIMQSDPERALPLLENLLKGAQSPKLKERTLFVLAQSNLPRAQQLLEQVARGGGNPDLQLKAINYVGVARRKEGNSGQVLSEIYAATTDVNVKRAILMAFAGSRDKDHLLQAAKTEKSPELRFDAIRYLVASATQAEMWQLYQAETAANVKEQILNSMSAAGNTDKLIEVARSEKDARLRRAAIRSLSAMRTPNVPDALAGIYASEQDQQIKQAIIDSLYAQGNAKAMVDIGRKEPNVEMKRYIVSRLTNMKSKEATDFLMEILK